MVDSFVGTFNIWNVTRGELLKSQGDMRGSATRVFVEINSILSESDINTTFRICVLEISNLYQRKSTCQQILEIDPRAISRKHE